MDTRPQITPSIAYPAPDPARPYVYPGTQVLINYFNIGSMDVLEAVVNTVAGLRGQQLDASPPQGAFDLTHLCAMHHVLFQDVFAWAGQVRTVDTEKQGQDFALAADIPGRFRLMHDALCAENFLRGLGAQEFVERLAHYWYEVYAVHAFRDGNSRAMRHFFALLAAAAGYRLEYAAIDRAALLMACRSMYFEKDMAALHECLRRIAGPL